ncbi:MAG: hypothetical protein VKL59_12865 [Nostocaceae cyanobacterium]|nr:hypothetical protein [Nostocaceae cyanobacterium]
MQRLPIESPTPILAIFLKYFVYGKQLQREPLRAWGLGHGAWGIGHWALGNSCLTHYPPSSVYP